MNEIRELEWDSNFFELNIGELNTLDNKTLIIKDDSYDLIYIKSNIEFEIVDSHYTLSYKEIKSTFSKDLKKLNLFNPSNLYNFYDLEGFNLDNLYSLAFLSGKHSRFKKDVKISPNRFDNLYMKWVDNAINKTFNDYFIVYKYKDQIVGMLTMKIHNDFAQIGLIAVSEELAGLGIGSKLLFEAENFCVNNNILELRIPTQKENIEACLFYEKKGYNIIDETIIKHAWKI